MKAGFARLLRCSTVWMLGACSSTATEVELRLYPCVLTGGAPTSVELEIRNLDGQGAEIGDLLSKTFMIADPGVFDDGYASVGYIPPAGTVTADIKVTWTGGGESVAATYAVPVPMLGSSVTLGADECEGGPGTTTTPTTDGPTSSSGTATTGTDTTDTTGTSTGTTTNTTDSTSTSTGTTDSTTGTTTGTTDMTTGTTTGTTGGPQEGGDCDMDGALACSGGPGVLGEVLYCEAGTWVLKNDLCTVDACVGLGFNNPQIVGCFGAGMEFSCACAETPQGECTMGMESQCGGMLGDGVLVELCVVDGDNTWHYAAQCPACQDVDGEPLCTL